MNDIMIKTERLTKTYRRYRKKEGVLGSIASLWKRDYEEKIAVNQIDLSVGRGEFVGMIGPNGAGKTTLFRILAGLSRQTSGQAEIANATCGRTAPQS